MCTCVPSHAVTATAPLSLAMIEPARSETAHFLAHRDEILAAAGERMFPALPDNERKDKAKMLFASIDMDGSFRTFAKAQGLPAAASPSMLSMRLQDGTYFDMPSYLSNQAEGTGNVLSGMHTIPHGAK